MNITVGVRYGDIPRIDFENTLLKQRIYRPDIRFG